MTAELDLDELERIANSAIIDLPRGSLAALIQRLRKAEADRDQWKQKAWDGLAGDDIVLLGMEARVAQLERVREAATEQQRLEDVYGAALRDRDMAVDLEVTSRNWRVAKDELRAALTAVEEKP